MRIQELHVEGFGHFHQRTFGPVPGPVTVYYGPNEAGKSTLLAFIRAILFGFPRRYNQYYPPVTGGRHGGKIMISDGTGTAFIVERFAGAKGGLSVTTPQGPASNAEAVLQRLTGRATSDLFGNVFAFSLDELQEASSLEDSNGVIYSAGQGAPGLPGLKKDLSERKRAIYLYKGNNQEIPRLLSVLKELDEKLRTIASHSGQFGELTQRRLEIVGELADAESEIAGLTEQIAETDRLKSGWEDWVALCECESRLQKIPEYADFPETAMTRLENIEEGIRHAREEYESVAELLRQAEESADLEIPDEAMLEDRTTIEMIRRSRGSYDGSKRDLPKRQTELKVLKDELSEALSDLGQDWDEADLEAFDTSLVLRDQIDTWKSRFDQADESDRQLRDRLMQERRSLKDLENETREADDALPEKPLRSETEGIAEREDAIRAARRRLEEYERKRQASDSLNQQLTQLTIHQETSSSTPYVAGKAPIISLAVIGLTFIITGLALGGEAWLFGVSAGLVMLGTSAYLWRRGSPVGAAGLSTVSATLQQQVEIADKETEAARECLMDAGRILGLEEQPDSDMLDNERKQLDTDRIALDRWTAARNRIQEAGRKQKQQADRLEGTEEELAEADTGADTMQGEWRAWLTEHGLKNPLTPGGMTTFLVQVDAVREKSMQVQRMRMRLEDIERDIQTFHDLVEPLALRHGLTTDDEEANDSGDTADETLRRFDQAQAAFHERQQAVKTADEYRLSAERAYERLKEHEKKQANLLAAGGTDETESFLRKAREHEKRQDLVQQRDEHRRNLERLRGPGPRFESFLLSFDGVDPHSLDEQSIELTDQRDRIRTRCNSLRKETGGIEKELAQLTGEQESSALRIRKHALEEQMKDHASQWARFVVAEVLLERTQQLFEQERQPKVIQHARHCFSSITSGRYPRLFAPIGKETIAVVDSDGTTREPNELSRGTREQLYLALRFGLIREFGEHAETLPVVVDEALVNFDPARTRVAAEAFTSLSETNQVLIFTCHPHVCDVFADVAEADVVDIGG